MELSWEPVTDPSGLSHYIIYKNGILSNYTLDSNYNDYDYSAGDTISYSVSAMDRAGNESLAALVTAYIPDTVNKALNGGFENGKEYWSLYTNNSQADAVFEIDSLTSLEGNKSAKVTINQSSGNNQDIQLRQTFNIYANHQYKVEFTGKSSAAKTIDVVIQQAEEPYHIYLEKELTLPSEVKTFSDSVFIDTTTTHVKLEFYLGSSAAGDIFFDNVNIIESLPKITEIKNSNIKIPSGYKLFQNYPNPFNPTTNIRFETANTENVSLKIYNILGCEIAILVNEIKKPGFYSIKFDAGNYPSGIYFYELRAGSHSLIKKMVLLK